MKLKYYLRGLGTGIIVTALILGISYAVSVDKTMTDEEVLARAKQLGWSESTVLSEMVKVPEEDAPQEEQNTINAETEDITETKTETETEDITETETETETEDIAETEVETETEDIADAEDVTETEGISEVTAEDEVTDSEDVLESGNKQFGMPDEAGTVTITIVRGDSSDSVSRMLEEAGLVDSASAYDKYLCQNGYDKSIRVGKFDIPADATGEEIAKMITGR